jgi:hypothetical protein
MPRVIFKGKTQVAGKNIGNLIVLINNEQLNQFRNKEVSYTLIVEPKHEMSDKADKHDVKYKGFKSTTMKHYFDVTSAESGKTHLVDLELGCGCDHGGAQGIANGTICSHELAVFRYIGTESPTLINKARKRTRYHDG